MATIMLSALLLGCARAPVQELSDARRAVAAARAEVRSRSGLPSSLASALAAVERRIGDAAREAASGHNAQARRLALAAKTDAVRLREITSLLTAARVEVARDGGREARQARIALVLAALERAIGRGDMDEAARIAATLRGMLAGSGEGKGRGRPGG